MADTYKVLTAVDTVTSVSDTDYVIVNDSDTVKQITKANLLSELTSTVSENSSDIATNTSDISDIDDRVTTLEGGTITTDTTLSVSGMPADAEVVGDEISDLKSNITTISDNFFEKTDGTIKTYSSASGMYMSAVDNANVIASAGSGQVIYYISVSEGEKYRVTCLNSQLYSDEYIAVAFSENVPAVGVSVTPLELGSTVAKDISVYYEVTENGYLCMSKSRVSTSYYFVLLDETVIDVAQDYVKTYEYTETAGYFASDGSVQSQSTDLEVYTNKLAVYEGEKLNWMFTVGDNTVRNIWVACMYYDSAENVVGSRNALVLVNNIVANGSITIPTGVSYIAFTYRTFGTTNGFELYGSFGFDKFLEIGEDATTLNSRVNTDFNISTVKSINHRGYNSIAPENTLPAFKLSKTNGFNIVETDIRFTSDDVPVLLHDATVDRTSDGTGSIYDMTYETACTYDFGSWFSDDYEGTIIPTFEEFLTLCKKINLYAYCELETPMTSSQVESLISIAKSCGMLNKITWISFSTTLLQYVINTDKTARIGTLYSTGFDADSVKALETGYNEVFVDHDITTLTDTIIADCIDNELPLEVWTIDTETEINNLDVYVSGVTSDSLIAEKVMYDSNIN